MKDNIIVGALKNLVGYAVIVFVGTFIIEKIFAPFDAIPWCLLGGKYFKALILAVLAYTLYFVAAQFIVEQSHDGSGTVVMFAIFIFSAYSMYGDINEAAGMREGLDYAGTAIGYMIYALPETLRIVATFHALKA